MNMSERFETRGEIGHSISGVRDQLATQARVFTVAVGLSVIVLGFLYYQYMGLAEKYADLQAAHVRIESQLEAAISNVAKVKLDTEQSRVDAREVKSLLESALKPPGPPTTSSARPRAASSASTSGSSRRSARPTPPSPAPRR